MAWEVEVNNYGNRETTTVDSESLGEAVEDALRELGFDGNDEGHYIITVLGTGGSDD